MLGQPCARAKGTTYEYPRYQFSHRSDDIRKPFTDTCDKLSVGWRPWTKFHVSAARRDEVALLGHMHRTEKLR